MKGIILVLPSYIPGLWSTIIRIPINQPVFQWKVGPGFVGSRCTEKNMSVTFRNCLCLPWLWRLSSRCLDFKIPPFSRDSWMYPYQRTPMGNPYISPFFMGIYGWKNPQESLQNIINAMGILGQGYPQLSLDFSTFAPKTWIVVENFLRVWSLGGAETHGLVGNKTSRCLQLWRFSQLFGFNSFVVFLGEFWKLLFFFVGQSSQGLVCKHVFCW